MKITTFEEIKAWQKAKILTLLIYKILSLCKDYSFRDQIQRAALSIMNNIAEGFERNTDKELKNFLYIAKGSAGELRSMLYVAKELDYLSEQEFNEIMELTLSISRLLSAFIKKLN